MVAVLMLGPASLARSQPPEAAELAPGTRTERRLEADEVHVYVAALDAARRYLVALEQRGIDVVVAAVGPDGSKITVDAPTYRQGREVLLLPPEASGTWHFEVRPSSPSVGPGEYEIRLEDLRGAAPARLMAEAAMTEAARRNHEGTTEARRQAMTHIEEALQHWRETGERHQQGRALLGLGVLNTKIGEPRAAAEAYTRALPLLREVGDRPAEAIALTNLGLAHWKLGENDAAQASLDAALKLQKATGNRYGEAITLNNLCLRSHSQGRLRSALACYQEVLDLLRELGELKYEALVLRNLGGAYNNLGEPELAFEQYRRALALLQSTGDRREEARVLNNIAVAYRQSGETQEALDHYHRALQIWRQLGDRDREAPILNNIGYTYFHLGEPRRALPFLQQALELWREAGDRRGESIARNVLGQVQAALGSEAEAQELYRQALELRRAVGDRRGEASTLSLLGRGLLASGDAAAALDFFDLALEILEDAGDRREAANALLFRGECTLRLGQPEAARISLHRALALWVAAGAPHGEARTLTALAQAERRLGNLDAARRRVEAALEKVESLRTGVSAADLRATFLASQRQAYELNVDLLMELDAARPSADFAAQALAASERARARSLLDVVSQAGAAPSADPELRRRRDALLLRLNAKATRRLTLLARDRAEEESELELYQVVAELDNVEAEIRRRSPRYEALTRPQPLDLAGIQSLLDGDTLLLEYALGAERSFLWAVTRDSLAVHELPGRGVVETAARDVRRQLATFDPRAGAAEREAASDLSGLLLGPVAERLDGQRLVVVADGALHYIPFGVLPSPRAVESLRPGARPEPDGRTPLIARHEVVHLPSASSLAVQRRSVAGRPPAPHWAAVLADPVFDARDPRLAALAAQDVPLPRAPAPAASELRSVKRGAEGSDRAGFDRLPATRREAAAIANLAAPGEVLQALDFDASRALVLGEKLRRYRIIHFATHGLIHDESPHLSGLVLSLVDAEGQAQEGFLRLRDIYNLELSAGLVVLSGCQTALGKDILGEGLVGVTRGFMVAGVPRVVASLWRVEDRATAELMARFYRSMAEEGMAPAAALRAAQLSIANERSWRDPYYWGAFVLQGDWR